MANLDNLTIEITADASKANEALDKLIDKLGVVQSGLSRGFSASGINKTTESFEELANKLSKLDLGKNFKVADTLKGAQAQAEKLEEKLNDLNMKRVEMEIQGVDKDSSRFKNLYVQINQVYSALEMVKKQASRLDYENLWGQLLNQRDNKASSPVDILNNTTDAWKDHISVMGKTARQLEEEVVNASEHMNSALSSVASSESGASKSVNIKVDNKELKDASNTIKKITNDAKELSTSTKVKVDTQNIEIAEKKMFSFREIIDKYLLDPFKIKVDNTDFNEDMQNTIDQIRALENVIRNMESGTKPFDAGQYESAVQGVQELKDKFNDYKRSLTETEEKVSIFERLREKLYSLSEGFNKLRSIVGNALTVIKTLGNGLGAVLQGMSTPVLSIGKLYGKAFGLIGRQLNKLVKNIKGSFGKIHTFMNTLLHSFSRMVMRRFLYAVLQTINEAMGSLANFAGETGRKFNQSMSTIVSDAKYIGANIVAAFSPLINVVAPIIDRFTNKLVSAISAVNQFFAALSGSKVYVKATKQVTNYADSVKKANKAQKDLTLGIDELNINNPNSNNDSNDDEDAFGWEELPVDKIKSFLDLGKDLNAKLKELLSSIPWNEIKEKAYQLGYSIGEFVKGFTEDSETFYLAGKTIAEGFNTILYALDGFSDGLGLEGWGQIGDALANFVNGIAENIEWKKAYEVATEYGQGIGTAINHFTETINAEQIGADFANIINTISTFFNELGETLKFDKIGQKISEAINGFIENLDVQTLASAIQNWTEGLLDLFINAVQNIDWKQIPLKIIEFINSFDTETIGWKLGTLISSLAQALYDLVSNPDMWSDFGTKLGEGINGVFQGIGEKGWADLFGGVVNIVNGLATAIINMMKNIDLKQVGKDVANGLNKALADLDMDSIAKAISDIVKGILDFFIEFIETTDWKQIGKKIAGFVKNLDWDEIADKCFEGIGAALGGLAEFIWGLIEDAWVDVVDWWYDTAYEDGEFTMEGLLKGILDKLKSIGTWIKEHIFDPFVDGIEKAFGISSPAKEMGPLGQNIILGILEGFKSKFGEMIKAVGELKDDIIEKFASIKDDLEKKAAAIGENLVKKWNDIKENVGKIVGDIWINVESVWETIKSTISEKIESAKEKVEEIVNKILEFFSEDKWTLSGIKDGLTQAFDNAIEAIKGIWNKFAEWLNDHLSISWDSFEIGGYEIIPSGSIDLGKFPTFEKGGFIPGTYSVFTAGENGVPEILGTVGGKSAVAGGEEITGIRDQVYESGLAEQVLLGQAISLLQVIADKDFNVDLDGRSMVTALQSRSTRNGYSMATVS